MALHPRHRRLCGFAGEGLRWAVIVGAALWLNRRLEQRRAEPRCAELATAVEDLRVAHVRLADTLARRLRSLEESAARAEAEVRFMAAVVGEQNGAQPARRTGTETADGAQRAPHLSERVVPHGRGEAAGSAVEGTTA